MSIKKKLPSLSNVAPGSKATLNIPRGRTYKKITLEYSGTGLTRALMKNIELLINGKQVQYYRNGDVLDFINDYYGRSDTAGFLTLWFDKPELILPQEERALGLGTADVQNVQLRFDIDATVTSATIDAHAETDDPQPLGFFTKVKEFQFQASTTGTFEVDSIPKGPRIMAIHLDKNDVTNVELEINSTKVVEGSKTLLQAWQKEYGRVPSANQTQIEWMEEGDIKTALATTQPDDITPVQDLRLRMTLGSSGAVPIVVEYLDTFSGI